MDIIHGVFMVGVTVIALLVVTYITGTIQIALPAFGTVKGGSGAADFTARTWNLTMENLTTSSQSAMSLQGVVPFVIGAGLIIGILISVFYFKKE